MVDKQQKMGQARDLFLKGHNCAQSVAAAYAAEMELDETTVLQVSGGFGGGVGGMRATCGAVSGMALVMGRLTGYDSADDADAKKHMYALVRRCGERFQAQYETLVCRELLESADIVAKAEPSPRTPEYYRTRPCVRYVEACAGILADVINEEALV